MNHRQQPVTSRLDQACFGLVSTVFSRKIYFIGIDQYIFIQKMFNFKIYNILYAQLVNSLTYYFDPKYFVFGVCSPARISRGRYFVKGGRFLLKQGTSPTIKHSPSCYNIHPYPCVCHTSLYLRCSITFGCDVRWFECNRAGCYQHISDMLTMPLDKSAQRVVWKVHVCMYMVWALLCFVVVWYQQDY